MLKDWANLDINTLRMLYKEQSEALANALISGVKWDDVRELRKDVTELAIVLHKKVSEEIQALHESEDAGRH